MAKMDAKEESILLHYKEIIENRTFDEYDILGFLIFIRRHLSANNYKYIRDFADLIAHRVRNKGIVHDCILACRNNKYATGSDGKSLKEYRGIDVRKWNNEWSLWGKEFNVEVVDETIKEITLCVFTLSQNTVYMHKEKGKKEIVLGTVKLFRGQDKSLGLITVEDKNAPLVVFAKCGQFDFVMENTKFYLKKPVETIRENGRLRLFDEDGYII